MIKDEIKNRIAGIVDGPWKAMSLPYLQYIKALTADEAEKKLKRLLRAHWLEPINSAKEIELRESFDEALGVLQLMELAIETNYLQTKDLEKEIKTQMRLLLKTKAARNYVHDYSFIGVRFLAARIGMDLGMKAVSPPEINTGAAMRFASFRAQNNQWYESEELDDFLGLLDDYRYFSSEESLFIIYLKTGKINRKDEDIDKHFKSMKEGAFRFIVLLSDLFGMLEKDEFASFGIFYSYWMAKFFGYDLSDEGYEADAGRNWSLEFNLMNREAPAETGIKELLSKKDTLYLDKAWKKRIAVIKIAWEETQRMIDKNIKTKTL